jgi:hypothetical protein
MGHYAFLCRANERGQSMDGEKARRNVSPIVFILAGEHH